MEITTLIAMIAAVSGVVLGWVGRNRAFKQEVTQEASGSATLRTDVQYIKRGVDDIQADVRVQGQRTDILTERVTRVEESAKQAHHRINKLEE
ncbi:hypothetical protein ACFRAM_24325 [Paenibacillus sp. NPDC056722]|uniref:hypothetical protein n=1 Tax=Paenibacillus sp. NPDC056722 TaxID=3345924 RepID=UPI0036A3DA88